MGFVRNLFKASPHFQREPDRPKPSLEEETWAVMEKKRVHPPDIQVQLARQAREKREEAQRSISVLIARTRNPLTVCRYTLMKLRQQQAELMVLTSELDQAIREFETWR